MSSVYVSEPQTKGKVVLSTTMGPLDIELWPKEAPKAVRNFVQLCLEGYYDGTIFHRIISSFLVQGGDPTGSGTGGESIYGNTFVDEFHSRLRFNHRGLVACANAGPPHSNGSQFFITLDRCDGLDRKNTIFGKVTGDSIYNLLRLGEVETDKDDKPLDPPKLLSIEVLWNPFDDVIPRQLHRKPLSEPKIETMGQHQKKAVKKLNMLSFGEEAEEEEKELEAIGKDNIKSIYDVLDDPRFIKGEETNYESSVDAGKKKDVHLSVREALSSKKCLSNRDDSDKFDQDLSDGEEESFDARMRLQILKKRRELGDMPNGKTAIDKSKKEEHGTLSLRGNTQEAEQASKVEKLSLKKRGIGSEARAERLATADTDLELLREAEQKRHRQKQKKRMLHGREEDTLAKLERFKSLLRVKTPLPSSSSTNENSDEDEINWNLNQYKSIPSPSGKKSMEGKDDLNIDVLDPLLAKGEVFNHREAKLKRRERDWAGKPIT